jgi:hypothetical protein
MEQLLQSKIGHVRLNCVPRRMKTSQVNEDDGELDTHKLNVPATISSSTMADRQEDGWVPCNCCVVDLIAFLVVEA